MSDRNSENLGGNRVYGAISGSEVSREGSGVGNTSGGPVEWGPAIAVDGKRPGFVRDDDRIHARGYPGGKWYSETVLGRGYRADLVSWLEVQTIRLAADHPHYRQTEAAPIDWSKPIEAVHEDGRVVPVSFVDYNGIDGTSGVPDAVGDRYTNDPQDEVGRTGIWLPSGEAWSSDRRSWHLRNVPQAGAKPDLTARMEALVRRMADNKTGDGWATIVEARAIVALLPEPVDPDEQYARDLIREQGWSGEREIGSEAVVVMIAKARRDALALAGEKEA